MRAFINAPICVDLCAIFNFVQNSITPLHVASKWGRANMVQLLLDRHAAVDCRTRVSAILHAAIEYGGQFFQQAIIFSIRKTATKGFRHDRMDVILSTDVKHELSSVR